MHRAPDISIVISTYNRAAVLEPALRAVLADQRTGDATYEVIVVDNNSADRTRDVLRAFAREYAHLRWLFEPRQGVSHGRNAGILAAAAPIIAFTDDDIRAAPDWVATIKTLFDEHPGIECLGGAVLPIWSCAPPRWLDRRHWGPLSVTDYGPRSFEINAARPRCLLTSNMAVRAPVFARIGMFSPRFPRGQDHEFQVRYWTEGGSALYSPRLVVHTEVPPARMTKAYHRWWHRMNGRMCARMELKERCAPDGSLRRTAIAGPTLLGAPRFLFGELKTQLGRWAKAIGRGDASETFARELAVRHTLGYIAECRRDAGRKRDVCTDRQSANALLESPPATGRRSSPRSWV